MFSVWILISVNFPDRQPVPVFQSDIKIYSRPTSGYNAFRIYMHSLMDSLSDNHLSNTATCHLFMGTKDVTSAMLAAIFVSDVTTSTAHLYEIL